MPLRADAPFKSVIVTAGEDLSTCGSLGCEIYIYGVLPSGKKLDISQDDFLKNGILGTKAEVFGALDKNGMPAIVLELGLINGGTSYSLFNYDVSLRRYKSTGSVSGYAAGKKTTVLPNQAPAITKDSINIALNKGTFRLTGEPAVTCPIYFNNDVFSRRIALEDSGRWNEAVNYIVDLNCPADRAYAELGDAFVLEKKTP